MTGFLGALVLALFLALVSLVVVLVIVLNRTNERRMLAVRHGDRLPVLRKNEQTCCFEVPCSAECASRRQTLMITGAVEAMRGAEGFQHVMRLAEQVQDGSWPPAMPGDGNAGHPAA